MRIPCGGAAFVHYGTDLFSLDPSHWTHRALTPRFMVHQGTCRPHLCPIKVILASLWCKVQYSIMDEFERVVGALLSTITPEAGQSI